MNPINLNPDPREWLAYWERALRGYWPRYAVPGLAEVRRLRKALAGK